MYKRQQSGNLVRSDVSDMFVQSNWVTMRGQSPSVSSVRGDLSIASVIHSLILPLPQISFFFFFSFLLHPNSPPFINYFTITVS
ncbi:hypothetical protein ACN38_g7289 [Penicillium nordicum]|uniref:Uncharacterized protein n=1 Tax=Penicillium nordicum TaxID=229535 RepID=A0A0M9WEI0_9EURO|nr:hypothetical protein ACN38_g7289 [Penicillium nordicum]